MKTLSKILVVIDWKTSMYSNDSHFINIQNQLIDFFCYHCNVVYAVFWRCVRTWIWLFWFDWNILVWIGINFFFKSSAPNSSFFSRGVGSDPSRSGSATLLGGRRTGKNWDGQLDRWTHYSTLLTSRPIWTPNNRQAEIENNVHRFPI